MKPKKGKPGRPAGADPVVRATFTIPGEVLKRAKRKAKEEARPLSAIVAGLIEEWTR